MSKHTKGPWRRRGAIIWGAEIQREVARVKTQPGEPLQDNANARLIAAAPELLEALQIAVKELNRIAREGAYQPMMVSQLAIGLAEQAIAKAEGSGE